MGWSETRNWAVELHGCLLPRVAELLLGTELDRGLERDALNGWLCQERVRLLGRHQHGFFPRRLRLLEALRYLCWGCILHHQRRLGSFVYRQHYLCQWGQHDVCLRCALEVLTAIKKGLQS